MLSERSKTNRECVSDAAAKEGERGTKERKEKYIKYKCGMKDVMKKRKKERDAPHWDACTWGIHMKKKVK